MKSRKLLRPLLVFAGLSLFAHADSRQDEAMRSLLHDAGLISEQLEKEFTGKEALAAGDPFAQLEKPDLCQKLAAVATGTLDTLHDLQHARLVQKGPYLMITLQLSHFRGDQLDYCNNPDTITAIETLQEELADVAAAAKQIVALSTKTPATTTAAAKIDADPSVPAAGAKTPAIERAPTARSFIIERRPTPTNSL